VLFLSINTSYAETFYFSNSGDDSSNGLSPIYPLKSIDKLNSLIYKLKPGDAVLFERGSFFNGQIIINASGDDDNALIFGAYGSGANPIISGSIPIINWTNYKANISKAYVNTKVKDLFTDENRMVLARYPNSGYLRIDYPYKESNKGFTDTDLKQSQGYWSGSNVRIRTENWAYEHTSIKGFKDGSITFNDSLYYYSKPGWGYYLDNNINQLDTVGEWYFEDENIYFYSAKGINANEINVQATVSDYGFFSVMEISNVIIRNLEFRNQFIAGIYFAKVISKLKIENCTFKGQNQLGISIPGESKNNIIKNCRFYNINGKALYLPNTKSTTISNNIFQSIGMIPGYGTTGDPFTMSAIVVFGDQNKISGNNIDGVGHDGINCIGSGNVIEKNVIKNSLMLLNDGGAIKCYGEASKNSEWKNNFIFNVPGNIEATDKKYNQIIALGFYLDELANNIRITQNTIAGCGFAGIGTHAGFENIFENNICYSNSVGIGFYGNEILCKNNNINNNIIFSNREDQLAILNHSLYRSNVPGRFENNYYFNPGSYNIFRIRESNIISDYNFEKWKRFVKSDNNSDLIVRKEVSNSKLFTNMSDDSLTIFLNSDFKYTDLYLNSVNSFITLQSWSSVILLADSDISNLPEINIAGGTLDFEDRIEVSSGNSLWYNIMGNNLKSRITITAPEGFEISLNDDSDFSNSLSLNPDNGKIDKIIFVKFSGSNNKRYYDYIINKSDNITVNTKVIGNSRF